jgi:hypothetical protein
MALPEVLSATWIALFNRVSVPQPVVGEEVTHAPVPVSGTMPPIFGGAASRARRHADEQDGGRRDDPAEQPRPERVSGAHAIHAWRRLNGFARQRSRVCVSLRSFPPCHRSTFSK